MAVNALADVTDVADMLIRASRKPNADWGVEYSRGPGALLPELALIRFSARLLRTTASAALYAQRPDVRRAGECVVASLRMARHASEQRTLISSLVSAAVANMACEDTQSLVALNRLDATSRDEILRELRALQQPDALRFRAAINEGERSMLRWITDAVQAERGDPKRVISALNALLSDKPLKPAAKVLDEQQFAADLTKQTALFDALVEAWAAANADERLAAIEKQAESGEFGYFAKIFGPTVSRAKAGETKTLAAIANTINAIENYTPPNDLPPAPPTKSIIEELGLIR